MMPQNQNYNEIFWRSCVNTRIANAYELEEFLGYGACGCVFVAWELVAGEVNRSRKVAVRLIFSESITNLQDFKDNLRFAKDNLNHRNIVEYYDLGETTIHESPVFYLAMELADDGSVAKLYQGQFSSSLVKSIVKDVAEGLRFLHEFRLGNNSKPLTHRNIKPSNILRFNGDREGEYIYKISDFGSSPFLSEGGTLFYMPPEYLKSGKILTIWDVWSLGIMIVKMLTGSYPFNARTSDDLKEKIKNNEPDPSNVPNGTLLRIVRGCLTKRTDAPYPRWTARMILNELEGSNIGDLPNIPNPESNIPKTTKTSAQQTIRKKNRGENSQNTTKNTFVRTLSQLPKNIASSIARTDYKTIWKSKLKRFLILLVLTILLFFVFYNNRHFLPLSQADRLFDAGEKKEAIAKYQEVIGIKPDDQHSYSRLGVLKYLLGDYQGAIASLDEAIRLNPNDAVANDYRAKAIEQLKKLPPPKPFKSPVPTPSKTPTPVPTPLKPSTPIPRKSLPPVNPNLEPLPPVERTPIPVEPTPVQVEPTPEPVKPTPVQIEPTPEPVKPTPEPTPELPSGCEINPKSGNVSCKFG